MRTLIVTLLGVALLAAFVVVASFRGGSGAHTEAAYAFIVVWFLICVADWAYGVFKAAIPQAKSC